MVTFTLKWHFGLKMKILKLLGISSTYSAYKHFVPMILWSMSYNMTNMEHKNIDRNCLISGRGMSEFITNVKPVNLEHTDRLEQYQINVFRVLVVIFSPLGALFIVKNVLKNWMKMENQYLVY